MYPLIKEAYENLFEMSRSHDYTTGKLLEYQYHQKYCRLTGTYLSGQTNTTFPQQINFTGNLEEDNGKKLFFITEKNIYSKVFFRFIKRNSKNI